MAIAPEMIRLVVDTTTEKALFSLSIPPEAVGASPAEFAQAGILNGRLELDVLFDTEALYARAPFLAQSLPLLLGQFGEPVEGDLTGWLRLATKADFEALREMVSAMQQMSSTTPDLSEWADLDTEELQQKLEGSGITLLHEGGETHNGIEAEHLGITLDYAKMADSPPFEGFDARQLEMMAASGMTITADMWFERASGRPIEFVTQGSSVDLEAFELRVTFSEPDPGFSFDVPANFVDLPILELFGAMFTMPSVPDGFDGNFDKD